MKIILVGNYAPDNQESMERFTTMLYKGFTDTGIKVEIWKPIVFFGSLFNSTSAGLPKWFGYLDKWLLFPLILTYRIRKRKYKKELIKFHICDHSNAPYLQYLPKKQTVITCHDVLAIRGALGFKDAYCQATPMGTLLQKWILKNLSRANKLAAVSNFTLNQLKELSPNSQNKNDWRVIHNAFNAKFEKMGDNQSIFLLKQMGLNENESFLLHVGSNLERKNRKLLLKLVAYLDHNWHGKIYFAGQPIENDLINLAKELKIMDRVVSITKPNHNQLLALYSTCEAFIFPSYSEGFGWPVIEAQACGSPVIASNVEPMPEVSGNKALHINPNDPKGFGDAVLTLKNKNIRAEIINSGYQNIKRFNSGRIIDAYISLHRETI
ncbi:MAG: glycosyltransferase family 4 protein [Maribacter stanieri]